MPTGSIPPLTVDEIHVIVEEAHKQGLKVAAHATTPEGIKNAVTAGVDSIEHGHRIDRADLELMQSKGTFLVPTVGVIDGMIESRKTVPSRPSNGNVSTPSFRESSRKFKWQ